MSATNRAELINKIHRILKKHAKPYAPPADRTVLEHMLYACCLENAKHESADEAFAKLQQLYFDWNEVRVTSTTELAETMSALPDPNDAASRLKRCLQSVFETHYSFDLEGLRKQNIGKTQADMEKYVGVTPFTIAYLTQNALGGHAIPLNRGVLELLQLLGVIGPADAEKGHVPGLERTIPKNKGVEFGSLLHDFGVDFALAPTSTKVRAVILEVDPDAKDRLPKRIAKKDDAEAAAGSGHAPARQADKPGPRLKGKVEERKDGAGARPGKPEAARSEAGKPEAGKTEAGKPEAGKTEGAKPEAGKSEAGKKMGEGERKVVADKGGAAKDKKRAEARPPREAAPPAKTAGDDKASAKTSTTKRLTKKKPR